MLAGLLFCAVTHLHAGGGEPWWWPWGGMGRSSPGELLEGWCSHAGALEGRARRGPPLTTRSLLHPWRKRQSGRAGKGTGGALAYRMGPSLPAFLH